MFAAWFSFVAPDTEFFSKNCLIFEAALHSAVKSKIQIILNLIGKPVYLFKVVFRNTMGILIVSD